MEYFEDMEIGSSARFGRYEVTREEAIDFASKYDPQPFHLSEEEAAKSPFGRLAVSGWHTAAMAMAMVVGHIDDRKRDILEGLGLEMLRWERPVHPGDVLYCIQTVLEKRDSKSRPYAGIVRLELEVFNQNDERVMHHISSAFVMKRPQTADI